MANDSGTQQYDYLGSAAGPLLTSNDGGTQKYDYLGSAGGPIGVTSGGIIQMPFNYCPWLYQ